MVITAPCVVALTWRLEDTLGNLIDELEQPLEFFFGGDDLLAKVEETLANQEAGFRAWVQLEPEHAFGDYDARLVFFEDRSVFPGDVDVGMRFDGLPEGCKALDMPLDATYTVTEVYPTHVVLDGNHPLAGIALRLDVVVRDVRSATLEEIARGSVTESDLTVLDAMPSSPRLH
ncbi:MAG: peptidylprolyl isomerase [Burkholderiaceae bacterium]|nr:peptidylprolyl isomerase [Burkholderiaceae bacterium]MDH3460811.1 peptidylprolyl isomerase [Burkholderiaceae bacterium]